MPSVKRSNQPTRRKRAEATRSRIIESAYELFAGDGYPSATMEAIAQSAGVAVQTVYYVFGTKAGLLRAVTESAAAGFDEEVPVMERSWVAEALSDPDPRRALALGVEYGVDIYARVAPLENALRAAASADPEIDEYIQEFTGQRRRGMARLISGLARRGGLIPGLEPQRASDVLFVLHSHETFLGFTRRCGWTVERYKAWLYRALSRELLGQDPDVVADPSPTRGLSFA